MHEAFGGHERHEVFGGLERADEQQCYQRTCRKEDGKFREGRAGHVEHITVYTDTELNFWRIKRGPGRRDEIKLALHSPTSRERLGDTCTDGRRASNGQADLSCEA